MQRGAARRGQGASIARSSEDTRHVVARSGPGGRPAPSWRRAALVPRSTENLARPDTPGPPLRACVHEQLRAGWIAVCGRYSIRHEGGVSRWQCLCDAALIVRPATAGPTQRSKPFTLHLTPFRSRSPASTHPDVLWMLVTTLRRLRAVRIYRRSYFSIHTSLTRL